MVAKATLFLAMGDHMKYSTDEIKRKADALNLTIVYSSLGEVILKDNFRDRTEFIYKPVEGGYQLSFSRKDPEELEEEQLIVPEAITPETVDMLNRLYNKAVSSGPGVYSGTITKVIDKPDDTYTNLQAWVSRISDDPKEISKPEKKWGSSEVITDELPEQVPPSVANVIGGISRLCSFETSKGRVSFMVQGKKIIISPESKKLLKSIFGSFNYIYFKDLRWVGIHTPYPMPTEYLVSISGVS